MNFLAQKLSLKYFLIIVAILFASFAFMGNSQDYINATVEQDLQNDVDNLDAQIKSNEARLATIRKQVDSLERKLSELKIEIENLQTSIEKTELEIELLEIEIEKAEIELDRQVELLSENLKTLYIEGNVSSIDLILSSSNFSDFVDQQEYLASLKNNVQQSASQVKALKEKLEADREEQQGLLDKLVAEQEEVKLRKTEQEQVLEATKGEEARYRQINTELQQKREEAEIALNDYLASLIGSVSLGPVNRGEFIGTLGMSGYSTGPHLHFKVYTAGTTGVGISPTATINANGWAWPVGSNGGYISQGWGCTSYPYYPIIGGCYWHDAIDIAGIPTGTPLYSPADGDIVHRGCLYGEYQQFSTYGVIIEHAGGYYSLFIHMKAPDASVYDGCRNNTYYYPWSVRD